MFHPQHVFIQLGTYLYQKGINELVFFISGTLGLVTKVALACPPKPTAVNVAFLGLQSYQSVLATFKQARQRLGEILSSCEFLDAGSLQVYLLG